MNTPETQAQTPTLAQRCFDSQHIEMELFDKINEILGCNSDDCLDEGFKWGAYDTFFDNYDGSVEVIRNADAQQMTREQANAILALGFGQIYESIGDTAYQWTRDSVHSCSPRTGNEHDQTRANLRAATAENARLREVLKEAESTLTYGVQHRGFDFDIVHYSANRNDLQKWRQECQVMRRQISATLNPAHEG